MKKDSIGNRIKGNYELRQRWKLIRRMPVIIRLDGKAFHTVTRKCEKPFDAIFSNSISHTALTLLVTDFDKLTTEAWFDYNKSKIESISAGIASATFTNHWCQKGEIAVFDSRSFNIPKEEVCNYFIWRQQDWVRNSVHMYARFLYSHKELQNKNQSDMHEMIYAKGLNWADLDDRWKNGTFIYSDGDQWLVYNIIFTKCRDIIEGLLIPKEE